MEAAPSHLLGPGMHKKKKASWALTLTSLCVLTVNTLWPTASGSCHMTFSLLWLGPWAVNQSKHFCSQVALVRNIVTVLRGAANSTLCLLFTFPWEWFFFSNAKRCLTIPVPGETLNALDLAGYQWPSMIVYEALKSGQSKFASPVLASSLTKSTTCSVLFLLYIGTLCLLCQERCPLSLLSEPSFLFL